MCAILSIILISRRLSLRSLTMATFKLNQLLTRHWTKKGKLLPKNLLRLLWSNSIRSFRPRLDFVWNENSYRSLLVVAEIFSSQWQMPIWLYQLQLRKIWSQLYLVTIKYQCFQFQIIWTSNPSLLKRCAIRLPADAIYLKRFQTITQWSSSVLMVHAFPSLI